MTNDPRLDFSFSGLKTALLYAVRELGDDGRARAPRRPRRELSGRGRRPAGGEAAPRRPRRQPAPPQRRRRRWDAVALGGGVAANSLLRERVAELCEAEGLELKLVARELCTDNAAMIASAARFVEPTPYPGLPRLGRAQRG